MTHVITRANQAVPVEYVSSNICGIRVDNVEVDDVLRQFTGFMGEPGFHLVVTPNVDFVVRSQRDELFRTVINESALSIPDGQWLARGARLLKIRFRGGIAGRKLVEPVCEMAARHGWSVYILASWGRQLNEQRSDSRSFIRV
jgi:UDP-N-acetyl-D-mannosaminuronic acid transferase (WecB/TagA/CpsF family)